VISMPLPGLLLQATQPDLGRLLRADDLTFVLVDCV